jgi:hypothetical protein
MLIGSIGPVGQTDNLEVMVRRIVLTVFALFIFVLLLQPVQASQWGCDVLLCAASDNPSWHGVASCRPPMEKLIDAMKRPGFSWPTCPEGGAGKPGYDRYADCPVGWAPAVSEQDDNHGPSTELSRCSRTVQACTAHVGRSDERTSTEVMGGSLTRVYSGRDGCEYTEYVARPLRNQPYYFDIKTSDDGAFERHYFDLRK